MYPYSLCQYKYWLIWKLDSRKHPRPYHCWAHSAYLSPPPLNSYGHLRIWLYMIATWLFVVVQLLSHVRLFATPWTPVRQAPLSSIISQSLLKFMSIELVMPSNHLILCHPLLLPPSVFPSIRVFSTESVLHIRYWSQSIEASTSASVLPKNIQGWFPLGLISLISCSPRDSQVSFPTPQLKSINSIALSFLYSPTLTSIHDYWKNHSFD